MRHFAVRGESPRYSHDRFRNPLWTMIPMDEEPPEIQKEFRDLHHRLGKTMIFVTHDIREAFLLGTRIGLMQEGRLVAIVKPEEFLRLDLAEARAFAGCLQ